MLRCLSVGSLQLLILMCFSGGTGSNAGGWLDQLCMVGQSTLSVTQGHVRWKVLSSAPSRDKGPISFTSRVAVSASSRLNSGLRSPCGALREGPGQHTIPHYRSPAPVPRYCTACRARLVTWLLVWRVALAGHACSYDIHHRLQVLGGISSCRRSLRPKAWTAIPVLGRPVWVEMPAQAGCSASVCVSASALQLRCMDTIFCQEDTVSSKPKTKPKKGKKRAHLGDGGSLESRHAGALKLLGGLPLPPAGTVGAAAPQQAARAALPLPCPALPARGGRCPAAAAPPRPAPLARVGARRPSPPPQSEGSQPGLCVVANSAPK